MCESTKIENEDIDVTEISAFEKNVHVNGKNTIITFSEIIEDFEKNN